VADYLPLPRAAPMPPTLCTSIWGGLRMGVHYQTAKRHAAGMAKWRGAARPDRHGGKGGGLAIAAG